MEENTIRIGGVPEHFNFPWTSWLEENVKSGISWKNFPGGSGAMIQALVTGELDAALVLTEAVAHALNQNQPLVPLAVYVESPLVWGIFSGAKNPVKAVIPNDCPRYAISRMGSGSHLMAKVDAHSRGGKITDKQFIAVGNLEGAVKSLTQMTTDLFFWEKWMTRPLVDSGMLKQVDERPTPWSCFLLVVNNEFSGNQKGMQQLRYQYAEVLKVAKLFKRNQKAAFQLAEKYGLKEEDAASWLKTVIWAENWIEPETQLRLAKEWLSNVD